MNDNTAIVQWRNSGRWQRAESDVPVEPFGQNWHQWVAQARAPGWCFRRQTAATATGNLCYEFPCSTPPSLVVSFPPRNNNLLGLLVHTRTQPASYTAQHSTAQCQRQQQSTRELRSDEKGPGKGGCCCKRSFFLFLSPLGVCLSLLLLLLLLQLLLQHL